MQILVFLLCKDWCRKIKIKASSEHKSGNKMLQAMILHNVTAQKKKNVLALPIAFISSFSVSSPIQSRMSDFLSSVFQ